MLPQTDDEAEIADHAFIHMWTNGDEMVELDVAACLRAPGAAEVCRVGATVETKIDGRATGSESVIVLE